jgi:quercetin dioxygenase-like cupin family protein
VRVPDSQAEPRTIDNPISGERIIIRTTAADSDGRLLAFDLFLPPGGHVPAWHAHPIQEERFTIVRGELTFRLGRRSLTARAGDTILIPPGTSHWFGNTSRRDTEARVEIRPALRMQELLELGPGLSQPGRPRLRALARFLLEFQRELAMPVLPPRLGRALLWPLARLGS